MKRAADLAGMAIAQLTEKGKLSFADKVGKHLHSCQQHICT